MKRRGMRIDPISATEQERGIIIPPDTQLERAVPVKRNCRTPHKG